jgi:MmgE/PrpD N-terminal domain
MRVGRKPRAAAPTGRPPRLVTSSGGRTRRSPRRRVAETDEFVDNRAKRLLADTRRMPMSLTQDIGRFVADLTFERLPSRAVEVARVGFIDCIATMIAGAGDPAPQLLRKILDPRPGVATLYFTGETAPAPEAAWVNGTAAHALDYDDVASLRGHPSTRPGLPVHVPRLRAALPGRGCAALHGLGRRRLRQCPLRELLRDPGVRAPRPATVCDPGRSAARGLRLHRGLV